MTRLAGEDLHKPLVLRYTQTLVPGPLHSLLFQTRGCASCSLSRSYSLEPVLSHPFPLLLLTSSPSHFSITCVSLCWFIPNSLLTVCYCSHLKNRTNKNDQSNKNNLSLFFLFLFLSLHLSFFSFSPSPPTLFSHNWQITLCNCLAYHVMVRCAYISWKDDHKNASWRISHPQIVTFFGVWWEHLRSILLANFRCAIQCSNGSQQSHAVHVSSSLAFLDST